MTVRLVDTNIVSFVMNSHTLAATYRPHLDRYNLAVSFQTVAELWAGAGVAKWGPARRAFLTTNLRKYFVFHSDSATCDR